MVFKRMRSEIAETCYHIRCGKGTTITEHPQRSLCSCGPSRAESDVEFGLRGSALSAHRCIMGTFLLIMEA